MGILRSIFGPSLNEIWGQVAQDIGGVHEPGGFFSCGSVRYQYKEWEVVLDSFSHSDGEHNSTSYTRFRAPFVNKDGLDFGITHIGFLNSIGIALGMQDIKTGDPYFDEKFRVFGNNEEKIRQLFSDDEYRSMLCCHQKATLKIEHRSGIIFNQYPKNVDALYFAYPRLMTDVYELKELFMIFGKTLERLVAIDSAYETDPAVRL